jgi:hypothetical protein
MRKSKKPLVKPAAKARKTKTATTGIAPSGKTVGQGGESWDDDRRCFYAELRGIGIERGYKPGWAAMQYKAATGNYPPWDWNEQPERTPTERTLEWVRHAQAAFARSRSRQHGAAIAEPSRSQMMQIESDSWPSTPLPPRPDEAAFQAAIAKQRAAEDAQYLKKHQTKLERRGDCLIYHLPVRPAPRRDTH